MAKSNRKKKRNSLAKVAVRGVNGIAALADAFRNHPEWYEHYPLSHLMGINFAQREKIGQTIPCNIARTVNTVRSATDAVITVDLVVPTSKPVFNEGMQIIMNKLRAASGSNITYTILDLMCYVLNAREIFAEYSICRRAILASRIVDVYDQDAPVKYAVMGLYRPGGIAGVVTNLASDTTRLNRLADVISAMIPIQMSLLQRTAWMFSNIFADSKTAKYSSKMFIRDNSSIYAHDNTTVSNEAATGGSTTATYLMTLTQRIDNLEAMLNSFIAKVENSRIAGDLMKAFGAFFSRLEPIDESTRIVPIYDEAALTQIQNASICPRSVNASSPAVKVTTSGATVDYSRINGADYRAEYLSSAPGNHLLNTYKDVVSPGEMCSLTMLTAECSIDANDVVHITSCGSEIVTAYQYVDTISPTGIITYVVMDERMIDLDSGSGHWFVHAADIPSYWAQDDWAPQTIYKYTTGDGTVGGPPLDVWIMFDLSNWATIDCNNLSIFHEAAVLSMLAVPSTLVEQSTFSFLR